ncbi:hypothetical protein ANO14919_007420 [Xylariales sp. No.14919]|nr:hypothetical protein ANO14919_007420 [Xylariales sp. No.14919]
MSSLVFPLNSRANIRVLRHKFTAVLVARQSLDTTVNPYAGVGHTVNGHHASQVLMTPGNAPIRIAKERSETDLPGDVPQRRTPAYSTIGDPFIGVSR